MDRARYPTHKIACVIGNGEYKYAPLHNAPNDARVVAAALRNIGFEVMECQNVKHDGFDDILRDFCNKIRPAESCALFYFSGHGTELDGQNYLFPTPNDVLYDRESAKHKLQSATEVQSMMNARFGALNILILDACRTVPKFEASSSRSIVSRGGLAQMTGGKQTLISFSASPGEPAFDFFDGGSGLQSSIGPFASAFAKHVQAPDVELTEVFRRVRCEVADKTMEKQTPWESQCLRDIFVLHKGSDASSSAMSSTMSVSPSAPMSPPPSNSSIVIALPNIGNVVISPPSNPAVQSFVPSAYIPQDKTNSLRPVSVPVPALAPAAAPRPVEAFSFSSSSSSSSSASSASSSSVIISHHSKMPIGEVYPGYNPLGVAAGEALSDIFARSVPFLMQRLYKEPFAPGCPYSIRYRNPYGDAQFTIMAFIDVYDENPRDFVVTSVLPFTCTPDRLMAVGAAIMTINFSIGIGSFEIDSHSLEIRFKTSCRCDHFMPVSPAFFQDLIDYNMHSVVTNIKTIDEILFRGGMNIARSIQIAAKTVSDTHQRSDRNSRSQFGGGSHDSGEFDHRNGGSNSGTSPDTGVDKQELVSSILSDESLSDQERQAMLDEIFGDS